MPKRITIKVHLNQNNILLFSSKYTKIVLIEIELLPKYVGFIVGFFVHANSSKNTAYVHYTKLKTMMYINIIF